MKSTLKLAALSLMGILLLASCADNSPEGKMDRFVSDLMDKMTVEEKIGQLNFPVSGDIVTGIARNSNTIEKIKRGEVGGTFSLQDVSIIRQVQQIAVDSTRLGIPLIFGLDIIHGFQTVFPIPLGLSCSWDMDYIEESARVAAEEASVNGIGLVFSPMVDITRDPRWGRVSEGSGEDPYLGSAIASAMVRGYQGDFSDKYNVMACVKHFALYGASEAGRDYNTVDMSRTRMYNDYLPPYKAAVDAGVGSVMPSFNVIDGIPSTVNHWLLTDLLRKEWGFEGFTVSDYTGLSECVPHGMGNLHEVSVRALKAGLDADLVAEGFLRELPEAYKNGEVSEKEIDLACRRVLEAKYKLGLFDDPYKFCREKEASKITFGPEHRAVARKISADSYVLLKNDSFKGTPILPLKQSGTVAVIGPLGNTRANMPGTWSVSARFSECPSLVEGLREAYGNKVNFLYAQGSNLCSDPVEQTNSTLFGRDLPRGNDEQLLREALSIASKADVIVAALGESSEMTGESSSKTDISIPDTQRRLLKELLKTGKPVVLVLFNGRPLTIEWEAEHVPAILDVWFGGSEAAYSIGDVLFGEVNPSGHLTMTFPRNVGQIPIYYERLNTGRPAPKDGHFIKFVSGYIDSNSLPLYPFGYGLSYTTFEYSPVTLSSNTMSLDGRLKASVTVTNTGDREGKEVVQLYIRDMVGKLSRPLRQLRGFEKISLAPGESKTVEFTLTPQDLGYYDNTAKWICEPGEFKVFIGSDSSTDNEASFTLTK